MNLASVIAAICSLLFFMVGLDKFYAFLEPPCSLMDSIPTNVWYLFGVLQFSAGILIWFPMFRKPVAGFFTIFMLTFSVIHLLNGTNDIGGSSFMAVMLGLLFWNPKFIRGKKK